MSQLVRDVRRTIAFGERPCRDPDGPSGEITVLTHTIGKGRLLRANGTIGTVTLP